VSFRVLECFLCLILLVLSCTGSGGGGISGVAKRETLSPDSRIEETLGETTNSSQIEETLASGDVEQNTEEIGQGDGIRTTFSKILSGSPVIHGTVRVLVEGTSVSGRDDGSGNISGTGISGSIDYSSGEIIVTLDDPAPDGESVVVSYKSSFSNRGAKVLKYRPQPLSVLITDGVQILRDNGTGSFTGDGSGTVDYSTGFITWNFNSYPFGDVVALYEAEDLKSFAFVLGEVPVIPGTLGISIGDVILTDNGSGSLTGDGTGTINYSTGLLRFSVNTSIPSGVPIVASYEKDIREFSYTVSSPPIEEGSVLIQSGSLILEDDGKGKLEGDGSGTIDYESGSISFRFNSRPTEVIEILYISLAEEGN